MSETKKRTMWAVFENQYADDTSQNIYNYDCLRCFETEKEAIDFEMENSDYRVRRLIRM